MLGLRYRNAIILGTAEETTQQWFDRGGTQDDKTRSRLADLLAQRCWRAASGLVCGAEEEWLTNALLPPSERRKRLSGHVTGSSASDKELVRLVFQRAATQETNRLAADDRWARIAGLYWPARMLNVLRFLSPFSYVQSYIGPRQAVTRGAFRINQEVWAPLRLAWAVDCIQSRGPVDPREGYAWRTGPLVRTCVPPEKLAAQINQARSRLVLLRRVLPWCRRGDWLTRYNSACVHAVAMKTWKRNEHQAKMLAEFAVEELEHAVLLPKGGFATVERTWMVHEDPDLALLRENPLFKHFERTAYPGLEKKAEPLPSNWSAAQMRAYDHRLLEEAANVMQRVWTLRGVEPSFDIRVAAEWLQNECDVWECMQRVTAPDRLGHWEDRVELIAAVRLSSRPLLPATLGFPPSMLPDGTTEKDSKRIQEELRDLQNELQKDLGGSGTHYGKLRTGQDVFSRATANGVAWLNPRAVHTLCAAYSAVWQTLAEWLGRDRAERHFAAALGRVPVPSADGLTQQGAPRTTP
ncbi:hypothetical protein [Streptomyces sp. NPDC055287]